MTLRYPMPAKPAIKRMPITQMITPSTIHRTVISRGGIATPKYRMAAMTIPQTPARTTIRIAYEMIEPPATN